MYYFLGRGAQLNQQTQQNCLVALRYVLFIGFVALAYLNHDVVFSSAETLISGVLFPAGDTIALLTGSGQAKIG